MSNLKQRLAKKNLERLLKTPEGQAAIAEKLNVKPQTTADQVIRPNIAILVPCREAPRPEMANAMSLMIQETRAQADIFVGPVVRGSSIVSWTRNWLLSDLIKLQKPWTHVLFLDDDIVPKPGDLLRLISHKKDIIVGLCTRRQDPPLPNIRFWREETKTFEEILEWPENATIEIGAGGTGMMLISRSALEKVANAWINCLFEIDRYGLSGDQLEKVRTERLNYFDKNANGYWFRLLESPTGKGEMGEDVSFCYMARQYCDLKIFCDTSVQPDHMGGYGYGIKDYLPYRRDVVAKLKAKGEYQDQQIAKPEGESQIAVLLPTRGRAQGVRDLYQSLKETSHRMPEVVLYVDEDDAESLAVGKEIGATICKGPRQVLSKCWNDAAKATSKPILMQCGDDIVFKTKGWDTLVEQVFENSDDKLILVHGHDGHWGREFGTHCFVHRKWVNALGYMCPPYFACDYNDTWLNEVANALDRRVFVPIHTEHLHPAWGKRKPDQTDKERMERGEKDNVLELYKGLEHERLADVEKLRALITKPAISVMIPARGRPEKLAAAVESLLSTAKHPNAIEVLVRVDDDEKQILQAPRTTIVSGPCHGYQNLFKYYNELASQSKGDWLLIWNDDAEMQSADWDEKIRACESGKILNLTGQFNTFPVVHRSVYESLGHISLQAHCDTWLQQVSRSAKIEVDLPLQIKHESRDQKGTKYEETRKEFYSTAVQYRVHQDADKLRAGVLVG